MSQKLVKLFVDDLDGSEANETIRFGFEGVNYDIDLSAANAQEMRDTMRPFVENARRVARAAASRTAASRTAGTRSTSTTQRRTDLAAARDWLRAQGETVSDKGRIAAVQLEKYRSAVTD
ncbi:Lsr2 family protein [Cryobacterium frigoriphilum]|uniref:Lsr2 family protein n=1 Tax=Cryobacterium frigoriphilum TaxID=1259150 RepID=A0A4R9A7C5_9MICO|nr:Lsr2 family protein [Cryobacterium frigoriphilum]TFD53548.1 Lsr2 family protein [Cryobacterium frigoriphilum]